MTASPRNYAADGLLRDGSSIHIRAIRPDDKERLLAHFRSLGPGSVYNRFLAVKSSLSVAELRYFTEPDFDRHVGLVATRLRTEREEILGVARYFLAEGASEPIRAEMAVAVADSYQGRGVGTLLLEHLAHVALQSGVREFEAEVLGSNARMLDMLKQTGLPMKCSGTAGVLHFSLETEETDGLLSASDARAFGAARESVRRLLHPGSVAVVGASRKRGSIGAALVANLKRDGFRGAIYPVNPAAERIERLPAYPSLDKVPGPVDLVLIAVPAPAVEKAVADSARAGAAGVVVISAGFAEVSEQGKEAQGRLTRLARESGLRLVGPNCMGILNTDPAVSLNATFAPISPPPGNVGFLSQSGALGAAILDHARALEIGISSFVSVGNKADVSGNDLLAYWRDDPRTDVIALYLESFGNPRRFARLAPEVARRKPIVAVKSGRSTAGTRAAASHSAALACLDVAVDALFEQAGVIRTETLEDLFDVVALLATQPVPKGPRVGVVTNAGGPGILLADACEAHGLLLPEFAAETVGALRSFLPAEAGVRNPADLIASARPEDYGRAVAAVGADPGIDAVVVIYVPPLVTQPEQVAAAIAEGAARIPREKPVLSVFLSSRGAPSLLGSGPRGRIPSFSFPENAARALSAAARYGRWRARPRGQLFRLHRQARDSARAVIERSLEAHHDAHWLEPGDVEAVLTSVGIPHVKSRLVAPSEAVTAAEAMGFPLVAKAVASGLVHKSDVGGVILGLESGPAVAAAVDTLRERLRAREMALAGVLLQREIRGGIEALVGAVDDPTFGPLVVCGLGGIQVELLRDASFRLPPVTDLDAAEMIGRLRLSALFDGYRGSPQGDRPALAALIQRVSALVEAVPELRELDLNPVKSLPPGEGVIVLDARMRVGPARG